MATGIPVVDLEGVYSSPDLSSCPQVGQIHSAFSTIGFVFVKNHGIPRKSVSSFDSDSRMNSIPGTQPRAPPQIEAVPFNNLDTMHGRPNWIEKCRELLFEREHLRAL